MNPLASFLWSSEPSQRFFPSLNMIWTRFNFVINDLGKSRPIEKFVVAKISEDSGIRSILYPFRENRYVLDFAMMMQQNSQTGMFGQIRAFFSLNILASKSTKQRNARRFDFWLSKSLKWTVSASNLNKYMRMGVWDCRKKSLARILRTGRNGPWRSPGSKRIIRTDLSDVISKMLKNGHSFLAQCYYGT
jgi:hypothetical protein